MFTNVLTDYLDLQKLDIPTTSGLAIDKEVDLQGKILSTPQKSGGIIYIQTQSKVIALDNSTHKILWEYPVKGRDFNSPVVVINNIVIAPSANESVIALDAMTGSLLWNTPASKYTNTIEDIQAQNDLVFIATFSNSLESRKLMDGMLQWSVVLPSRS